MEWPRLCRKRGADGAVRTSVASGEGARSEAGMGVRERRRDLSRREGMMYCTVLRYCTGYGRGCDKRVLAWLGFG